MHNLNIFILAAGRGTRISRQIGKIPKCLLEINKKPLLVRNVELFRSCNVSNINISIGYENKQITTELEGQSVSTTFNPCFEVTNSLFSLYLTLNSIGIIKGHMLLINGDVFFEKDLLSHLVSERNEITFFADSSRIKEADYKLAWTENREIVKFGKDLSDLDTMGEYVGAVFVPEKYVKSFIESVNDDIYKLKINSWWEETILDRKNKYIPKIFDVKPYFWAEFDFIEDFQRVKEFIKNNRDA
jgi:choline kinase